MKRRTSNSKVEGKIVLSPPWMGGGEFKLMKEAYDSGFITPCGPMVDRFEEELASYMGMSHAAAVCGGTAALALIYHELGVKTGDVIFCSDLTFIASIGPAVRRGAKPVFIDSDPNTWMMDTALLEKAMSDAKKKGRLPKCVTAVDLYGQCCDYDELERICEKYDVPLVIDAAEALGARYKNRSAGDAGFACAVSFNGNKIITTSGGGMLLCRDEVVVDRARKRSQQSRENFIWYEHKEVGYNLRLSNVCAAIGIGQLKSIDKILAKKRAIYSTYNNAFAGLLEGMPNASYGECSRWLSVFLCRFEGNDTTKISPIVKELVDGLRAMNIESRPVWKPMHLQPCFKGCKCYGGAVSERLFSNGICLPSGAGLTVSQQNRVIKEVKKILKGNK